MTKSDKPALTTQLNEGFEPGLRLLDDIPGLLWRSGPDGRRDYFNPFWLAFTGRSLEAETGEGWLEGVHPQDVDRLRLSLPGAAEQAGPAPFEVEYRLLNSRGEYRWMRDRGRPFSSPSGDFAGYLGIASDVTEQKQSVQTLKESQALFEGLFKNIPDGVIMVDRRGHILLANRKVGEMFGFALSEIEGQPVEILMPEASREVHARHVHSYMAEPRVRPMGAHLSLAGRRKDGKEFPVDITLGPLQIGGQLYVLATIRDITDRRLAENELRRYQDHLEELVHERTRELEQRTADLQREIAERGRAEEQVRQDEKALELYAARLKRSNRDLQDFASIVSHDLQEPLRKIQAFGERLEGRHAAQLDEEGLNYIARMRDAARRMSNMLEDLLAYSRVSTKGQPYTSVDLAEVIQDVVSDLEIRLEESGGSVRVDQLPVIEADHMQMHQLFQNLIGNALKFHKPDVPPQIEVTARPAPESPSGAGQVLLRVQDNGIGFEERFLEKLFQPFQRLHTRQQYPGSGMGLAICRKIVERHGGSITAESRLGEGTVFLITLPVRQPE